MCMTLTEISMHEAFFLWCKQKPMFSPSLWSFSRYGHEDKYGVRRHVKQLIAKQSTQKPPEVTGVENGNMFKKQSVVKRDKEKTYYVSSEKECDIWIKTGEKACTPSMALTAGPRHDKPLWKNLCALTGVVWLRSCLRITHLFFPPPFFS